MSLDAVEFAADRRAHHLTGVGKVYPLSLAVRPSAPAGVDHVAPYGVAPDLLRQHRRVAGWRQRPEGRSEACGEGSLDLGSHPGFRASELGGVAREEVVLGLLWREDAYGGENPEGVGG